MNSTTLNTATPSPDCGAQLLALLRQQVQAWRNCPSGTVYDNGYTESEVTAATLEGYLDQVGASSAPAAEVVFESAKRFMAQERTMPWGQSGRRPSKNA